jgi:hypothetical protein
VYWDQVSQSESQRLAGNLVQHALRSCRHTVLTHRNALSLLPESAAEGCRLMLIALMIQNRFNIISTSLRFQF